MDGVGIFVVLLAGAGIVATLGFIYFDIMRNVWTRWRSRAEPDDEVDRRADAVRKGLEDLEERRRGLSGR